MAFSPLGIPSKPVVLPRNDAASDHGRAIVGRREFLTPIAHSAPRYFAAGVPVGGVWLWLEASILTETASQKGGQSSYSAQALRVIAPPVTADCVAAQR
jgi:hypothetical protein